jgi:hypothetical protein
LRDSFGFIEKEFSCGGHEISLTICSDGEVIFLVNGYAHHTGDVPISIGASIIRKSIKLWGEILESLPEEDHGRLWCRPTSHDALYGARVYLYSKLGFEWEQTHRGYIMVLKSPKFRWLPNE